MHTVHTTIAYTPRDYSWSALISVPLWGSANREIKVPSVVSAVLPKALLLKPGGGQNIAMHISSPTAWNFILSGFYFHDPFNFIYSKSSLHFPSVV